MLGMGLPMGPVPVITRGIGSVGKRDHQSNLRYIPPLDMTDVGTWTEFGESDEKYSGGNGVGRQVVV